MKTNLGKLLLNRMMTEEGENALYTAKVLKDYSHGTWTRKKMELALKMIAPKLGELAQFYNMNPLEIERISMKSGIPIAKLSFVCMLLKPSMYFPMNSETIQLSKKLGVSCTDYERFLKEWRKLLQAYSSYVDDFLEMYLLLFGRSDERISDNSVVEEMVKLFQGKDFLSLREKDVKDFRDIYSELLPSDKAKVTEVLTDPYVKGAILRTDRRILIVDGSNIALVRSVKPTLENIYRAFRAVGNMKKVPWPFYIIFDANFEYTLRGSQLDEFKKKFLNHPRVSFHSPADEKILEMASSFPSAILTNDRYLDYPKINAMMLRFDGRKVWEDRRRM